MSEQGNPRGVGGETNNIMFVNDEHPFNDRFGHYRPSVTLNDYSDVCHHIAKETGWWTVRESERDLDLETTIGILEIASDDFENGGNPTLASQTRALIAKLRTRTPKIGDIKTRNAGEGARKDLMDDKLPHRKMLEVELADTLIRIFDFAGGYGLDLEGALREKLAFNKVREDHKPENREKEGGKRW